MPAINYGSATLGQVDEKYFAEAKTNDLVNNGDIRLEWHGKQTLTIYTIDVVPENDYIRDGRDRFGEPVELGNQVQTFTLSQDKAVSVTVDRGNREDADLVLDAKKHSFRQVREVSVPTTDKYRLNIAFAYAVVNSQGATSTTSNTDMYQKFLTQQAALDDALVPEEGRVALFTPTALNKMKRDAEYKRESDASYKDMKTGTVAMIDGTEIRKVPTSYLPANSTFLLLHKDVLISPTKFNMIRILTEVAGLDGALLEMRRYYDCFIPKNKGTAIRFHKES